MGGTALPDDAAYGRARFGARPRRLLAMAEARIHRAAPFAHFADCARGSGRLMVRRSLNATGRAGKTSGRFALLPLTVLKDPAVTSLDPAVFKVLVAMTGQYSSGNNGALALTLPAAREYGIRSSDTLRRSLKELEARGLIDRTFPGSYRPALPARFAINWQPLNNTEWTRETRTASHSYKAIRAVRPPDPAVPATGPTKPRISFENVAMVPATGPTSAPPWVRPPDTSRYLPLRNAVRAAA